MPHPRKAVYASDDEDEEEHCCFRSEPYRPTCWDFCLPFLYLASLAASLMTSVPMGRVTFIWQSRGGPALYPICPLFAASRSRDTWGQHDTAACYTATFLPVVPLAVALCLCVYTLAAVVYADRASQRRAPAGDLTVFVTTLATAVLCLAEVGVLTDGVRNTCFGFQVEDFQYEGRVRLTSFNEVLTCKQGFDMKDRDHMIAAMDTYGQLVTAMVGAWVNASVWLLLLFASCLRACHWCSACGSDGGPGGVPAVRVVRRRRSRFADEFPEIAQRRRESWV